MARLTKRVNLGDREVEVKELTVGEIRKMFLGASGDLSSMSLQDLLGNGFQKVVAHFAAFVSLSTEEIESLTPSEIREIYEAIKELNPDFFGLTEGLSGIIQILISQLEALKQPASSL